MKPHIGKLTLSLTLPLSWWALALPPAGAQTGTVQALDAIQAAAEAGVTTRGSGVHAQASRPDPRLRLPNCDRPLTASVPADARGPKISVRVGCEGAASWSVWVPVQVETDGPVVVARRPLVPGTVLTADDLSTVRRRIPGLPGCCAAEAGALLGQRVRRPVPADAPVPLQSLEAAPVIRRGDPVTVIATAPGFEVRSAAVALGDARVGDVVRVRHEGSLKVVQARADSRGVVRAGP
jgi:flagella basal body P-ring formation protein FlgA